MRFYMIVLTLYSILATALVVLLALQNRELKNVGNQLADREVNYDEVHEIDIAGAPATGPEEAPITLVEFSDFQCPACIAVSSAVNDLVERYPGKVRRVFKHFPLSMHPDATPAAAASMAAHIQGQFWPMRDQLFTLKGNLNEETFLAAAQALELDMNAFQEDMGPDVWKDLIQEHRQQGIDIGVLRHTHLFCQRCQSAGGEPRQNRRNNAENWSPNSKTIKPPPSGLRNR